MTAAALTATNDHTTPQANEHGLNALAAGASSFAAGLVAATTEGVLADPRMKELVANSSAAPRPTEVKIIAPDGERLKKLGAHHEQFGEVLAAVQCGPTCLVGPAGSGKTTLAKQVAEALDLPFHFNGAVASEFKLTGFIDASGKVIRTAFREAFEHGGVYLFDEIDASIPAALLALNAALANGMFDFPDGTVEAHKDFKVIAAANTWGRGADLQYVGRSPLDAATVDRFIMIPFEYDEGLERELCGRGLSPWRR